MVNKLGPFECVLDTGAYGSVIDKKFAQKHGFKIHPLTPDDSTYFTTADETTVRAEGIVTLDISLDCGVLETDFHVFKNLSADLLIGDEFCQKNEVQIDYKNRIVILGDGLAKIPFLIRGYLPDTVNNKPESEEGDKEEVEEGGGKNRDKEKTRDPRGKGDKEENQESSAPVGIDQ